MMEVKNLSFSYGEKPVLQDVSFTAEKGEVLSVLGPNGVGKSTLFGCMLRILTPQQGEVLIDGVPVKDMSSRERARHIAYIPQSHNPVFNYSVLDMALMGSTAQLGAFQNPTKKQTKKAEEALERLGILSLRDRGYTQISGGERQLALIARALVQDAEILVMDEPSSSLDYGNRVRVMDTVRSLAAQGYCIIQSTHDPNQAFLYSDKILALYEGRVLAHDMPEKILTSELISRLYGVEVEVCRLNNDAVRVCVPKGEVS